MNRLTSLILTALLLVPLATGHAQPDVPDYPAPPFYPPAGHPRVYFTAKDLPRLLANTTKKQNAAAWESHLKNLEKGTDGVLHKSAGKKESNANSAVLTIIESYAFDHALRGNREHGQKAIAAMRNYIKTVVFPETDYNNAGQAVFTIGVVYDWCHPLLTGEDRETFFRAAIDFAKVMEIGWPPVKQGNVVGHGPEGQLLRDLMSAAIAMHDERPEMYKIVAGRFFSRMVENKRFMYPSHKHSQGSHYVNYRGQWEMLATWIYDRMGLPLVFGPDQHYLMYWTLYARRADGQLLRDGDTHINNIPLGTYYTEPARTLFLAANYFNDPYLKNEAMRELPALAPTKPYRNQALNAVEILVFNNPDLEPRPFDEMPLTHYFPSPMGEMIARTGWEDGLKSASVVADMKLNEWYFGNHQHLDAGGFQIYYRGTLANDSGYYQAKITTAKTTGNNGGTGHDSDYDANYDKRSIAHNVMTVFDPSERFGWKNRPMANDGGQRMRSEPAEHSDLINPANGYHIGEILGHGFGPDAKKPDYTYLKGDLTKAYSAKINAYERSFVFLNLKQADHPAALVVFDRVVSSNPNFRKAWLLHGLEQPAISANHVIFKDTRPGYTGKLTVDTLLPAASDTEITSIGGPGKEGWVSGVNYLALTKPEGNNEGGGWRIEVSPKTARETDYFLNVLQVGDHTPDVPALPAQLIETDTHAGVRLADRVVLLAKARDRSISPVTFSFAGGGSPQILVADLKAGSWAVERDGKPSGLVTVSSADGLACFQGEAGSYRLIPMGHKPVSGQ